MKTVRVVLEMDLVNEAGGTPSTEAVQAAVLDAEQAIRNRLMGEGFLAEDIFCDRYTILGEIL